MNMNYTHNVQDPIVERYRPGEILSKPRIQKAIWTNLDQELSFILTTLILRVRLDSRSFFVKLYMTFVLSGFGQ